MRKLLVFLFLAVGLVLPAAPAHAATTIEKDIPFEATIKVCGETITLSGTIIGVFTEQPLRGDQGFLLTSHFNPQGVSGTSNSGARYQGTGLTATTIVNVPSGGTSLTFLNRFHLVGTAGAPTYSVSETYHLTVTPTGEITASVDNFSIECV